MRQPTIVLTTPGALEAAEREAPGAPGADEALVRVHRVGICGTDIHAYFGRQPFFSYPRVLGHELGVEVLALGAGVSGLRVGDVCSVEPYINCGVCIACRRGRPNCCVAMQTLGVHRDGGMCATMLLPARKLHVASQLSFEQAALVETLAIGAHAVSRAQPEPGETALVVGAGPIGLATATFARLAGARVLLLDVSAARIAQAKTLATASEYILADDDPLPALRALTAGDLPTLVFDATGNLASMRRSFALCAHTGKLVFVGLAQGEVSFDDPEFHRRELTVYATRNSPPEEFPRIIGLIAAGQIDTAPWVTHRAAASALPELFPQWVAPGSGMLKGVVAFT